MRVHFLSDFCTMRVHFILICLYYFRLTSLELAWAVGMIWMSFRQMCAGRVTANTIVSAMSSPESGVMPLYTLSAAC